MKAAKFLVTLGALAALTVPATPAHAATKIVLKKVATVDSPTAVVSPPGYKKVIFILERHGQIRVMREGRLLKEPFLDIRKRVDSFWIEQGLLGLAFPADYKKTGRFYVHYTAQDGDVKVDEYHRSTGDPYLANESSRRTVLRIPQVRNSKNHNGGQMAFRGNQLYIAVGDGNNPGDLANNAQNLESLRGKILRIDPRGDETRGLNYTVPATNPFVDKPGRDEIFAFGLRNPHSFDFTKGADGITYMTITDVGQERFEEINFLPLYEAWGGNFGWKIYEGTVLYNCLEATLCPNGADQPVTTPLIFPQLTYSHKVGCAIIGGPVISDPALTSIDNRIIYGDFCGNRLRTAAPQTGWITGDRPLGAYMPPGKGKHSALNGISEDGWGRVYVYSDFGAVYRLYEERVEKPGGRSGKK